MEDFYNSLLYSICLKLQEHQINNENYDIFNYHIHFVDDKIFLSCIRDKQTLVEDGEIVEVEHHQSTVEWYDASLEDYTNLILDSSAYRCTVKEKFGIEIDLVRFHYV